MEQIWSSLSVFLLAVLLFVSFKFLLQKKSGKYLNLPPSPPSRLIIGHLHLIKQPLHRTLYDLAQQYGPSVLYLRFGTRPVVIVTSQSAFEECCSKNDIIFANRPHLLIGKHLSYEHSTIGTASYGEHWRNLRRISAVEIFSTNRINTYTGIREDEVNMMVKKLFNETKQSRTKVDMKTRLSELTFNIIMRIIAGKRYYGADVADLEEARKFIDMIDEIFELSSASNPGDFLPFLQWFDFSGFEKKLLGLKNKTDTFLQGLIEEHRNKERDVKTMIDVLLSLQKSEPERYTDVVIKGTAMNLLTAGTDTSAATMEWAMSALLNHPEKLRKAKAEIEANVGRDRMVEESDLPKLNYIQCIVNETLRLYPATPLLLPHQSSEDCTIGGYDVPRGVILFVNAWAIHRDPKLREDPTSFKPERFEGVAGLADPKAKGPITFGIGRRACPGNGLANRVMCLALAALIQCFEWEREGKELVDMVEGNGLTMPKAKPLEALCKPSPHMVNIISQL